MSEWYLLMDNTAPTRDNLGPEEQNHNSIMQVQWQVSVGSVHKWKGGNFGKYPHGLGIKKDEERDFEDYLITIKNSGKLILDLSTKSQWQAVGICYKLSCQLVSKGKS